jgi:hypothetical protein
MQHTEESLAAFKVESSKRRKRAFLAFIPLLAFGLVLSISPGREVLGMPVAVWMLVLAVLWLGLQVRNWRCPACDRYLGSLLRRVCPRCGVDLG